MAVILVILVILVASINYIACDRLINCRLLNTGTNCKVGNCRYCKHHVHGIKISQQIKEI